MKYSAAALAAFVALASAAADFSTIPTCAVPCIDDAVAENTKCKARDFDCICKEITSLTAKASTCVLAECGNAVALKEVLPNVKAFCEETIAGGGSKPDDKTTSAPAPVTTTSASAPVETSSEAEHTSAHTSAHVSSAASSDVSSAVSSAASSLVTSASSAAPVSSTSSAPATSSSPVAAGAAGVVGSFGLLVLGAVAAL